jgi:hypothetical protein
MCKIYLQFNHPLPRAAEIPLKVAEISENLQFSPSSRSYSIVP